LSIQVVIVPHIHIKHIPFALAMLPFFVVGIGLPATIQDWYHGRLLSEDFVSILAGLVFVGAWEWAILFSIKLKKRRGQGRLWGASLAHGIGRRCLHL
jgi:hypothetical protein